MTDPTRASIEWMSLWFALIRARVEATIRRAAELPEAETSSIVASVEAEIERTRDEQIPAAWLRSRLGLSRTEEATLWLLVACEASREVRDLVASLGDGGDPTIEIVERIVYGDDPLTAWRELGPEARLSRLGLVSRAPDGDHRVPDHRQALRLARRIRGLALGDAKVSHELEGIATVVESGLSLDQVVAPASAIARVTSALAQQRPFVLLTGPSGSGRATVARAAVCERARRMIDVDCRKLATTQGELRAQLRVIGRETRLLDHAVLLRHVDALAEHDPQLSYLSAELVERIDLPIFATAKQRPVGFRAPRSLTCVELGELTGEQRVTLWRRAVPSASPSDLSHLASLFPLAPAVIDAVGQALAARGDHEPDEASLLDTIGSVVDDRLSGLATRLNITQTWDDLVLPDDQHGAVVELLARIRERSVVYESWGFATKLGKGLGIAALFSGPPGTGKTMAAGLIARDLGLQLYRVDLSQMVSKWVGETEKNLAALFDAAESTNAILLFDEADALFGKRSEVKSSNDRYANQEVNYLLQRLETFTGICLLTSNHDSAIDPAFRRRLACHIRFVMPDEAERAALWRAMIPEGAPLASPIDFHALGRRVEMSGGNIRNAALRAAFLAAHDRSAITMDHLWHAATVECEAMGKIAPRSLS